MLAKIKAAFGVILQLLPGQQDAFFESCVKLRQKETTLNKR